MIQCRLSPYCAVSVMGVGCVDDDSIPGVGRVQLCRDFAVGFLFPFPVCFYCHMSVCIITHL